MGADEPERVNLKKSTAISRDFSDMVLESPFAGDDDEDEMPGLQDAVLDGLNEMEGRLKGGGGAAAAVDAPPQKDAPPPEAEKTADAEPFFKEKEAIEKADKINAKEELNQTVIGAALEHDLADAIARRAHENSKHESLPILQNTLDQTDIEIRRHFGEYLSSGTARAKLGLIKIAGGKDQDIREGETLLLEAMTRRPELLNDAAIKRLVSAAYLEMAQSRKDAGLPEWNGKIESKYETKEKPGATTYADFEKALIEANLTYQENGVTDSLPKFQKAIELADGLPQSKILGERLDMFAKTLEFERNIAQASVNGRDSSDLKKQLEAHREKEWQKYSEYQAPGTVRINAGFALLNSGRPELLQKGKQHLADAIGIRPELQFDQDFRAHLDRAFVNHYKNNPTVSVKAEPGKIEPGKVEVGGAGKPNDAGARPPDKQENTEAPFKPGYKEAVYAATKQDGPISGIDDETEVSGYLMDKVTGPALTAALLYLGYRSVKGRIQRIRQRAADAAAAAGGTADNGKPLETSGEHGTRPDTTRRVQHRTEKNSSEVVNESLALTTQYHESRKGAQGRQGLDKHFDRFFAMGQVQVMRGLATTSDGKTGQLNDLITKFSANVDTLKNNTLLENATVVPDATLERGGKVVFLNGNQAIEPLFNEGGNTFYRTPTGELKSVASKDVQVEFRISAQSLEAANTKTPEGKLRATEIMSSVFHQMHQVDQLDSRLERAKMEKIDLRAGSEPGSERQFLEKEKGRADVSADYLQYSLNGKSLDGKTFVHATPTLYDIRKPLSELTGERILTAIGPDGRMKIFVLDKNRTVTELEAERSEKLVRESFDKLVEKVDARLKEAREKKDKVLEEKLQLERERILADKKSYETNPEFRKNVNHELGKNAGKVRRGAGAAVTVLFLTTCALEMFRQQSHGADLDLDIPIRGS